MVVSADSLNILHPSKVNLVFYEVHLLLHLFGQSYGLALGDLGFPAIHGLGVASHLLIPVVEIAL